MRACANADAFVAPRGGGESKGEPKPQFGRGPIVADNMVSLNRLTTSYWLEHDPESGHWFSEQIMLKQDASEGGRFEESHFALATSASLASLQRIWLGHTPSR
jgi:hypothetical protein